jgi:hypothetical protein
MAAEINFLDARLNIFNSGRQAGTALRIAKSPPRAPLAARPALWG